MLRVEQVQCDQDSRTSLQNVNDSRALAQDNGHVHDVHSEDMGIVEGVGLDNYAFYVEEVA